MGCWGRQWGVACRSLSGLLAPRTRAAATPLPPRQRGLCRLRATVDLWDDTPCTAPPTAGGKGAEVVRLLRHGKVRGALARYKQGPDEEGCVWLVRVLARRGEMHTVWRLYRLFASRQGATPWVVGEVSKACARAGWDGVAGVLLEDALTCGGEPEPPCVATIARMCARGGDAATARAMLRCVSGEEGARYRLPTPTAVVWTDLVDAALRREVHTAPPPRPTLHAPPPVVGPGRGRNHYIHKRRFGHGLDEQCVLVRSLSPPLTPSEVLGLFRRVLGTCVPPLPPPLVHALLRLLSTHDLALAAVELLSLVLPTTTHHAHHAHQHPHQQQQHQQQDQHHHQHRQYRGMVVHADVLDEVCRACERAGLRDPHSSLRLALHAHAGASLAWCRALVHVLCHRGELQAAVDELRERGQSGHLAEDALCEVVLDACARDRAIAEGRAMHGVCRARVLTVGLGNALLRMYVACGDFASAWEVFGLMRSPWVGVDAASVCVLLDGCPDVGSVKRLHADLGALSLEEHHQGIATALIQAYCRLHCAEDALEVYQQTSARDGIVGDNALVALLVACAEAGKGEDGQHFHHALIGRGVGLRGPVLDAVVRMYSEMHLFEEALGELDAARAHQQPQQPPHRHQQQQPPCDLVRLEPATWGALLRACRSVEHCDRVLERAQLLGARFGPTESAALVHALSELGAVSQAAARIVDDPIARQLPAPTLASVLRGCVRGDDLATATRLLRAVQRDNPPAMLDPDVLLAVVELRCREGDHAKALTAFRRLWQVVEGGVLPPLADAAAEGDGGEGGLDASPPPARATGKQVVGPVPAVHHK